MKEEIKTEGKKSNFLTRFIKNSSLVTRVFIGLIIGTILALLCPGATFIKLLGTLFIGSLKAIAPLLVLVLVMNSVATATSGLGKKFTMVIALYIITMLLAAGAAIASSFLFPINLPLETAAGSSETAPIGSAELINNIALLLVANPVQAIVDGNYIGILFWAVLFGLGIRAVESPKLISATNELSVAMNKVIYWIIQCAPLGIIGIVFAAISENGLVIFKTYGSLILLLVGTMLFSALVINPLFVGILLRRNPYGIVFKCLKESGLPAFVTRSSAANIPMNIKLCEEMGVQREFHSVSIPLGATINMNGAAITITVMTLAVCHSLGIEVSFGSAFILCIMSVFAACGASGVAGGSLLLIPMACSMFGISNEIAMQAVSIGFVIGIIQDSMETALNSSGDALFTITTDMYYRKSK